MLAKVSDRILTTLTTALAIVLLLFSGYMFLDNYMIGQNAFSSKELQAYKPEVNGQISFEMIQEVNPDTVAWLTIYDTHIDYPVVQGRDDLEYSMKNMYGKASLTGAIYLSSSNERDFSDRYNVIFGHHIDNNSMFGDLDNYADKEYLLSHGEGLLILPEGKYDLKIFAYMSTHAYDKMVYYVDNKRADLMEYTLEYIRQNSDVFIDENASSINKIIAMSTCSDLTTNGRMILFADAVPHMTQVLEKEEVVEASVEMKVAQGHNLPDEHCALINLICVVFTLLTLFPLTYIRKKFHQFQISREIFQRLEDEQEELNGINSKRCEISTALHKFHRKMVVGLILEIIAVVVSLLVFLFTETLFSSLCFIDAWTWFMIVIFAIALLVDYLFFRYRGKRPPEDFEDILNSV